MYNFMMMIVIILIFLWLSNPEDPESEFDTYHFKVVPFGATSSPFMLNAIL